jgi:hypothetical protein
MNNHGFGVLDIDTINYTYFNLHNPRPFISFKINSYEDIENGTEKLVNY